MQPWDQQPDEPPEAYARFLAYRNLGPGRSLRKAIGTSRNRSKAEKSGQWNDLCAKYAWVERSAAWDIDNLKAQGTQIAIIWADCVIAAARKVHAAFCDEKIKPSSFDSAVNALEKLAKYLDPDALRNHAPRTDSGGDPPPPAIPLDPAA